MLKRWMPWAVASLLLVGFFYATAVPGTLLRQLGWAQEEPAAAPVHPFPGGPGTVLAASTRPALDPQLLPVPVPDPEETTRGETASGPEEATPGPSLDRDAVGDSGIPALAPGAPSAPKAAPEVLERHTLEEERGPLEPSLPPPVLGEPPSVEPPVVRVMTFNIRHGLGVDGQVSLERVARVMAGADIVFLSEVDRFWLRSGLRDQPAELQELTGLPYAYYAPTLNLPGPSRQYGNLLLSRYPILRATSIPLPQPRGAEARVMIEAQIDVEGQVWFVFGAHLGLDREERRQQAEAIRKRAEPVGPYRLLLGDFNAALDAPELEPFRGGRKSGWIDGLAGLPATFPAWKPAARIDHILLSPSLASRQRDAGVEESDASDHLPAWVDLEVSAPRQRPVHPPSGVRP